MSNSPKPALGSIGWLDLTVPDAPPIRDFYAAVVGWKSEGCDMGGYEDFVMSEPASGKPAAGVCHARGVNADLPAQWLVYITVADIETSVRSVVELGGSVLRPAGKMSSMGRFAVIRDPAGAVCALHQAPG